MAATEAKSQQQIVYEAVQELLAKNEGMSNTEAHKQVAEMLDKSPATIATAFYREARLHEDSGVSHRPRSGRRGRPPGTRNRTTQAAPTSAPTAANNGTGSPVSEQLVAQAEQHEAQAKSLREMSALVRETEEKVATLASKLDKITSAIA